MKKFCRSFLLVMILVALMLPTAAMAANENAIYVDGKPVVSDTATYLKEGVTYVPLRFISEALGADVRWESGARTAVCDFPKDDINIRATVGSDSIVVNGDLLHHGFGRTEITNSRTFVPLRVIAEATGANVNWVPGRIDIVSPMIADTRRSTVYFDNLSLAMIGESERSFKSLSNAVDYDLEYEVDKYGYCTMTCVSARDILACDAFPDNTVIDVSLANVLTDNNGQMSNMVYVSNEDLYYAATAVFKREDGTKVRLTLASTSVVATLDNSIVIYTLEE